MILNTKEAIEAERRFFHQCGGELLYRLTYEKAGISQLVFKIGTFQHLLYYHRDLKPSRLQATIARVSFILGFLLGALLARYRFLRPKAIEIKCRYLIFAQHMPNNFASAKKILEYEPIGGNYGQFSLPHIKHLLWGRTPPDCLFEIYTGRSFDSEKYSTLRRVISIIRPAFHEFSPPARCWVRYGMAISPLIKRLKEGTDNFANEWRGDAVYFTENSEMNSLLAETLRDRGIRTILWHHGILAMLHLGRSTCEEIAVCHPADLLSIGKYTGKQVTLRLQSKKEEQPLKYPSVSDKSKLGYATNLLAALGSMPCYSEICNPNVVNSGIRCNEILIDFIKKNNSRTLMLKNHPRESISSYYSFINALKLHHTCEVNIFPYLEDFIKNIDHCICHPSSVAFYLWDKKKRVYIYKSHQRLIDYDSSLGIALKLVGFTSVDDLIRLVNLSDMEYWSKVNDFLHPQMNIFS